MRALHLLTLVVLLWACQARRGGGKKHHKFGGKELKPLHRVCQLNQFCDEGQFGPWIFEKGDATCADFQGANKKDDIWEEVFDKMNEGPQNCTQGTLNICALCFDDAFEVAKTSEFEAEIECEVDWRPKKPCREESDEDDEEVDGGRTRLGTSPKRLSTRFNKRRGPGRDQDRPGRKGPGRNQDRPERKEEDEVEEGEEDQFSEYFDQFFEDDENEVEDSSEESVEEDDSGRPSRPQRNGQSPDRVSPRFNRRRGDNERKRGNKGRGKGRKNRQCRPPMEIINICESTCREQ